MDCTNKELLTSLQTLGREHLEFAKNLAWISNERLFSKPGANAWNAPECLEHLNRYFDFYLPELQKRLNVAKPSKNGRFRSGWLGNYLAQSMLPKPKLNRMKTLAKMNPVHSDTGREAIDIFIANQQQFLDLLERMEPIDLTRTKTAISITPLVQLRLGDTLRFLSYHNERHIQQARRAMGGT